MTVTCLIEVPDATGFTVHCQYLYEQSEDQHKKITTVFKNKMLGCEVD
jgi:hypothetical protein